VCKGLKQGIGEPRNLHFSQL